jgi:hypothetical protein
MTEPRRVSASDFNFDEAPAFRKIATMPKANVVVALGGEEISTMQSGPDGKSYVETKNVANAGDYIATRAEGDRQIILAAKFPKLYEIDPNNPDQYRSKNFGNAVRVEQDVVITAPWGEDQTIKAGGIIFKSATGEVYGNQKHSFEGDFAREAKDGSLMPLSKPLAEQRAWAQAKGETAHLKDVESRMVAEKVAAARSTVTKRALAR